MERKSWKQIKNRLDSVIFQEEFDLIVAIARGGVIPGFLVSKKIKKKLELVWLRFRDDENKITFKHPKLIKKLEFNFSGKNILLVDDISRTGTTFKVASKYLKGAKSIKTFAINGGADYCLYDEECFKFPWN
ncbi:MAG: phosphoribosyltransferase [Candidatus Staskawiczbacteria bacterium]|nr:phosphoribosyltransferase [Candidatus Staskawiczbacteria bacterium]